MNSNFHLPQAGPLQQAVRAIWQVNDLTPSEKELILPKGVVEIIFDLGANPAVQSTIDQRPCHLSKCFINGFHTRPVQLQLPERQFFFGVQFHPVAVRHLLGIPAGEFSNLLVDVTLLNPSFQLLWEQLAEAETFPERVTIIGKWVESSLFPLHPQEQLLNAVLGSEHQAQVSAAGLAKTICYSPRHLSRKIQELSGMNTEQFLLYKKYLKAMELMHHTELSLTQVAYQSHFTDQSHFIRSFKSFAGITPKVYRQHKGRLAGHIFEGIREAG